MAASEFIVRKDINQSLRKLPGSWNIGCMLQLFSSLEKSWELRVFSHLFYPGGRTMLSEFMLVQMITIVLSSPQPGVLFCQCLDSGKTKTSLSGSPPKSEHLMLVSVFSFFPLGSQIMRFFFSQLCHTELGGEHIASECGEFTTSFSVTSFVLAWGVEAP